MNALTSRFAPFLVLLALTALSHAGIAQQAGTFGFGVELSATGAGATNPGLTLYALDDGGTTRLLPIGSTATLDQTDWTGASSGQTPTFNLGTFNPFIGNTLYLTGGSLLTFQNGGATVDTANQYLNWAVYQGVPGSPSFTGFNLPLNESNVAAMSGDTRFSTESQSINLLSGLQPGTYEFAVYGYSAVTGTTPNYESDNGKNYAATFTVVPEASTGGLLACGIGALLLAGQRRWLRRRA